MTWPCAPVATSFLETIIPALFERQALRDWILLGTPFAAPYAGSTSPHALQAQQRGPMKGPFYTNYWWGEKAIGGCRPQGSVACEIDAMMFLCAKSGRVLAIHIEYKQADEGFGFGKAEAYPLRAAHFADRANCPKQLLPQEDWLTLLFCDKADLGTKARADIQRRISHAEALKQVRGVGDV